MVTPLKTIVGLCSGVGLLEEAVCAGLRYLGFEPRVALCCEWEGYAAACLLARMEEQSVEPCPVWCGDLAGLDITAFRGLVDVLCAGLPCQPYSCAGKQRGLEDQRSYGDGDGPIPHALRLIAECRPAVVFFENVPPWVRGGWFRPVGEELCRLGYTLESPLFVTAESVGASHRRERVFVMAHALRGERESWAGRERVFDGGENVADSPQRSRRIDQPGRGPDRRTIAGRAGEVVDYAAGSRCNEAWQRPSADSGGRECLLGEGCNPMGIFAPGPGADWSAIPQHLWPAVERNFRFVVDGRSILVDESRADALRCIGNAVVPLQAAVAFVELARRAGKVHQPLGASP